MTAHRLPSPFRLVAVALVALAAGLGSFALLNRSSHAPVAPIAAGDYAPPLAGHHTTAQLIRSLQAEVRREPRSAPAAALLGEAYLQQVRETGDPTYYARADAALRRARSLGPSDPEALTGAAQLALARHNFKGGLALAQAAHREVPDVVKPLGAIVDAQVELGRYGAAETTLQDMVDRRPDLASYARVSYVRELHGDLPGAVRAMQDAVSAGGDVPENVSYVLTLLSGLELASRHPAAAERAAREALVFLPAYVPASVALAKAQLWRGELGIAIRRLRRAAARLPLPDTVITLGEAELAAGRPAAAAQTFALVRVEERLLQANGVNTDVDLAVFEAGHGSPARGVALARRAWSEAPSVRSADALTWALARAGRGAEAVTWAHRSLRLGTRDATFLFHAGMAARAAGDRPLERHWLRAALASNPHFSALYAPLARRLAR